MFLRCEENIPILTIYDTDFIIERKLGKGFWTDVVIDVYEEKLQNVPKNLALFLIWYYDKAPYNLKSLGQIQISVPKFVNYYEQTLLEINKYMLWS